MHGGSESLHDTPIATLPKQLWNTPVAIIGAGAAGLVAAYELLKIGVTPVVFEANPQRIGGRAYSQPFTDSDGKPSTTTFAEMGAMRFPPSAKLFFHYVSDVFDLPLSSQFPDPGQVPTKLYYQNTVIDWPAGQAYPSCFEGIVKDWEAFVEKLTSPLDHVWQKQEMDHVKAIWQSYIDQYKDMSFHTAVRQGIPTWTDEDMNKFGALGIGSGGFGPIYHVGFLEWLRIIINMWEYNQQMLPCGISAFMDAFYTQPICLGNAQRESLKSINAIIFNAPVTAISSGSDGNPIISYTDPSTGQIVSQSFPAVIVATSTRSMQMMRLTSSAVNDPGDVLDPSVKVAIRNMHHLDSSKMFIRTKTKFWKSDPTLPQNIQMDELPRGIYTLDYPQTENGVVLISYTWGADSTKLLGLSKEERFSLFQQAIAQVNPSFATHLVPMNGELLTIDWQTTAYYYGAFKMHYPGQDLYTHALYYQFLSVLDSARDRGVYLAGDSVSWSGGWIEGALHTGINAACAAAKRIGASVRPHSPLTQNPHLYTYDSVPH
jgi:tryptophan 2-monooxygenase